MPVVGTYCELSLFRNVLEWGASVFLSFPSFFTQVPANHAVLLPKEALCGHHRVFSHSLGIL